MKKNRWRRARKRKAIFMSLTRAAGIDLRLRLKSSEYGGREYLRVTSIDRGWTGEEYALLTEVMRRTFVDCDDIRVGGND